MTTATAPLVLPTSGQPTVTELWKAAMPTEREIRVARRRLHLNALGTAALGVVSYWVLVIASVPVWARALAGLALVAALVAVGTGVMHDANHGSFSRHTRVNRVLAYTMDFLGGSSWLWRFKHNHLHHGNPNVTGVDTDIDQAPFARLAPTQPWRPWHRYQHIYLWFLYGFMNLKNLFVGDWVALHRGRHADRPAHYRTTPGVVLRTTLGKAVHVGWAIVLPLQFHTWPSVLIGYVAISWAVGFVLAVVFQMAHCVDSAEFPSADTPRRGEDFVAFQMRTTVDIRSSAPIAGPMFRWLAGGLDYQVEHHLAPRLPHTVYAKTAVRFRTLCDRAGVVAVRRHTSVMAALRSHTRWLIAMGRPSTTAA